MFNKYIFTIIAFFFLFLSSKISSQDSPLWGDLEPGEYAVGFKVINKIDHSRPIKDKYDQNGNFLVKIGDVLFR